MPRLIISTQSNPYLNIAVESYLCSLPDDGSVTLYLWQNRRTVVIGQNQNPYSECNVDRLQADDGFLVRRRTGGGAVYHDMGNINFSFVVPHALYDQQRQFSVIQRAVEDYGLHTLLSGRNDILVGAENLQDLQDLAQQENRMRKFSGNAFSIGPTHRLHHGTILIKTDIEVLQRYLIVKPAKLQKHGVASVQSRVVNLSELVPPDPSRAVHPEGITAQNIIPHLAAAFKDEYGDCLEELDFDALAALPQVQSMAADFASPEWLYGRWRLFTAHRKAQFAWGGVELSLEIDEAARRIKAIEIATDCLNLEAVTLARQLLTDASTETRPSLPAGLDPSTASIIEDILSMIFKV